MKYSDKNKCNLSTAEWIRFGPESRRVRQPDLEISRHTRAEKFQEGKIFLSRGDALAAFIVERASGHNRWFACCQSRDH